jgi:alpha-glucosidase
MDYTPGAMRNAPRDEYYPDYSRPMSQGTRCHQLAMYVVYNQPLAMLCDSPTNYEKESEYTQFLASMPTVWIETEVLEGEIGEYIVVRKEDKDCVYIAGLNGNTPREVTIPIDLNKYKSVEIYKDSNDSASHYDHLIIHSDEMHNSLNIKMEAGGGFVVKLQK